MSATIDFSVLDKIPLLLEKIEVLTLKIETLEKELIPTLDLTTRSGVKKYLNISESSLSKKMQNQELINGIHYQREINGKKTKIIFVELAIIKYKKEKGK